MTNILIGKTITGLKIADDKTALLFSTTEGHFTVYVDAECCSYSWVEHIELPALYFPALVTAVEDLDMPKGQETEDGQWLQFYGCKITTDKGAMVIDYRNESNGYYGGSLSWPDESFYGGVYSQNLSQEVWVDVVEDI